MRIVLFLLFTVTVIYGDINFKLKRSYDLESNKDIILFTPSYFDVTNQGNLIIPDLKTCTIYNFNSDGSLKEKFGKLGVGPNEFLMPRICSIHNDKLAIFDTKAYRVSLYSIGKGKSNLITTIKQSDMFRGELSDGKFILSGFYRDSEKKDYSVFTYNIDKKTYFPLIPTYLKFGFKSQAQYLKHRDGSRLYGFTKSEFITHNGKYVFFVWVANLRIIRVNIETGEMLVFGKKTDKYIQPVFTDALKKAVKERDRKAMKKERSKYSKLGPLYSAGSFLFVSVYSPNMRYIQVYNLDGKFLGESKLPGDVGLNKPARIGFNKFDQTMYIMTMAGDEDDDNKALWRIFKYKVSVK